MAGNKKFRSPTGTSGDVVKGWLGDKEKDETQSLLVFSEEDGQSGKVSCDEEHEGCEGAVYAEVACSDSACTGLGCQGLVALVSIVVTRLLMWKTEMTVNGCIFD